MSKIKVSTLTGPLLDYWVAKAEKVDVVWGFHKKAIWLPDENGEPSGTIYSPSTDWSQGGPIIERLKPTTFFYWKPTDVWTCAWGNGPRWRTGLTPLIAAMRCFVASKFGEEVDE